MAAKESERPFVVP